MKQPLYKRLTTRFAWLKAHRDRFWLRIAIIVVSTAALIGLFAVQHISLPAPETDKAVNKQQISALPDRRGPVHDRIMTTVFWVGEPADAENDNISNVPSAWDGTWEASYGGYDNPDARKGYDPAAFTPHENPFYFALPYTDFAEDGTHKTTASGCLPYTPATNDHYSWCKNVWIAVVYGNKTVYAQWQDVGPNEDDDSAYVFGTAKPRNTFGEKAGLDVSPAVRDYLGLDGNNHTSWAFVPASSVPDGPWKAHVTTSPGYKLSDL